MSYTVAVVVPPVERDDADAWKQLDSLIEQDGPTSIHNDNVYGDNAPDAKRRGALGRSRTLKPITVKLCKRLLHNSPSSRLRNSTCDIAENIMRSCPTF